MTSTRISFCMHKQLGTTEKNHVTFRSEWTFTLSNAVVIVKALQARQTLDVVINVFVV